MTRRPIASYEGGRAGAIGDGRISSPAFNPRTRPIRKFHLSIPPPDSGRSIWARVSNACVIPSHADPRKRNSWHVLDLGAHRGTWHSICLTNPRIRFSPQARLVRGTRRAIVSADHVNVRPNHDDPLQTECRLSCRMFDGLYEYMLPYSRHSRLGSVGAANPDMGTPWSCLFLHQEIEGGESGSHRIRGLGTEQGRERTIQG